ncbi:MAG TPA: DUF3857 and transglutaminase domain-containing protein [Blastocatellia bacterium]|nr:DUF3857 and transglutaminase domain-containing protein [Blastocatellia bacterium]
MKYFSVALLLFFLSVIPAMAADSAPPWLQTAAQQSIPKFDKDVPAIVLWDEGTVSFNDKGLLVKHMRYAIKLLTRDGKGYAGETVRYNNDSKVISFLGWHIAPDGRVRKADKNEILDQGISDEAYTDDRWKIIGFSDAVPGSILGWEWETQENPYLFQDEWSFQGHGLPVVLSRYTLTLPNGWEARGLIVNHSPIKPSGNGNTYIWEMRDLPPVKKEPEMPKLRSITPWLVASFFPPANQSGPSRTIGSWRDMSRWYDELASGQVQVDDAISAKSKELTNGKQTDLEKIKAIAAWMQKNIRYVAIELGIGGQKPHISTSTYRNSYGDCKDKVTLMRSLLKASGIDSYFVLIYSGDRNFVLPDVPAYQFNHAIIAIKLNDQQPSTLDDPNYGRLLIFDPTDSITPVGDLPYYLQGSYGLLVKGNEGNIVKMPETGDEANKLSRTGSASIDPTGTIQASIRREMTGQLGQIQRQIYSELGPEKYRDRVEAVVSQDIPGVRFKSIRIADQESPDKPLALSYDFQATNYANQMGKLLMFKPTVLGRSEEFSFKQDSREYPVDLEMSEVIEDNIKIEIPQGYKVDELPDPEKVSTEFGQFETSYKIEGQSLLFHRRLALKGVRIPKDKYTELSRFFEHVYASDQASVVLTKQ